MPQLIRHFDSGDFGRRGKGMLRMDLTPYRAFLADLALGKGGILELEDGEDQRVVKRRLSMAATERDARVKWWSAPAGQLRFQLVQRQKEPVEATPPPASVPTAAKSRPRGRTAKQAAS